MGVVESYHLDRVLRQFGRVQTIPLPPLAPFPEDPQSSSTVDYEQRNADALTILDTMTERGEDHWVEDLQGLYTHV